MRAKQAIFNWSGCKERLINVGNYKFTTNLGLVGLEHYFGRGMMPLRVELLQ